MRTVASGVLDFQNKSFKKKQVLFAKLSEKQNPPVLFITCSDSRVDPNLITNSEPGNLFVIRNAGNIIPPFNQEHSSGEAATIEYALNVLDIKEIIICGHAQCGAMKGLLNPKAIEALPFVKSWLKFSEKILPEIACDELSFQELLSKAIEANVLLQIEHLRSYPIVKEKISSGKLTLNGWVYDIESGNIKAYDAIEEQFLPVKHAMELEQLRQKIHKEAEQFLAKVAELGDISSLFSMLAFEQLSAKQKKAFIWHQVCDTVNDEIIAQYDVHFAHRMHISLQKWFFSSHTAINDKIDLSAKSVQSSEGYRQYCSHLLKQEGFFAGKIEKNCDRHANTIDGLKANNKTTSSL